MSDQVARRELAASRVAVQAEPASKPGDVFAPRRVRQEVHELVWTDGTAQHLPVDGELPPLELVAFNFAPDFELPPPDAPPVVAMNEPPPQPFPDDQPGQNWVSPPIFTPPYPTLFGPPPTPPGRSVQPTQPGQTISPTPEPSTWMLLATSLFAIGTLAYRRPRTAQVIARRRR